MGKRRGARAIYFVSRPCGEIWLLLLYARSVVEPNEVLQARQGTGLSQAQFAQPLSISKRTLQEWEQGRRSPSGAAQALIRIARKHPEVVGEALA